jgi:Family of unknown function (DUF5336)
MTYSPGGPGYPPGQQPTTQFAAPTQRFGKLPESSSAASRNAPEGPSKLPVYLTAAVAALGLAVYLSSYGPHFTATAGADLFTPFPLYIGVVAALLAGLLAGVALVPKQSAHTGVIAVLSVLAFLLVIGLVIGAPDGVSLDWGLYLIIAFTALQAIVAVGVLLLDSGVITAPESRPKYEQPQQYGQYGGPGPYYGQPQHGGQPQRGGQPQHQGPQHRPGGYPSQYGGYPGGPSTGGFSAPGSQSGPPTPPTGFPAYGQPQHQQQPSSSAPTTQVPAQPQSSSSSRESRESGGQSSS